MDPPKPGMATDGTPQRVWHAASCRAPPKRPDLNGSSLRNPATRLGSRRIWENEHQIEDTRTCIHVYIYIYIIDALYICVYRCIIYIIYIYGYVCIYMCVCVAQSNIYICLCLNYNEYKTSAHNMWRWSPSKLPHIWRGLVSWGHLTWQFTKGEKTRWNYKPQRKPTYPTFEVLEDEMLHMAPLAPRRSSSCTKTSPSISRWYRW